MTTSHDREWVDYIERERNWLSANREKYEQTKQKSDPGKDTEFMERIVDRIKTVTQGSSGESAIWAIAQCRQIIADWNGNPVFIKKYERRAARVKKYDLEIAENEKEAADGV